MIYRKFSLLTLPFFGIAGVVGIVGIGVAANKLWVYRKEKKLKVKGPESTM